jgi:ureidoacrylate peracid hydrolase
MSTGTLDPGRTALLLFDMLNGHIKKDDPATQNRYQPVIAAAASLLHAARARGMMIAYPSANHRADNATTAHTLRDADSSLRPIDPALPPAYKPVVAAGSWEAQVIDELAPAPEDYLIPKYRWSAFYQTYLDLALRTRGVDTVILAGGSTEVGIASTAYSARDMDYNLVIVRDACTSRVPEIHDQLMRHAFPRMAWVRSAAEVVAMLGPEKAVG